MKRTQPQEREAADAEWLHEHRDQLEDDLDKDEEVEFEIARPLAVTTSFRMTAEEAAIIREAVRGSGLSQSEWIRSVCVAAANGQQSPVSGISALEARRLRGLLEQAEKIVWPATQAS